MSLVPLLDSCSTVQASKGITLASPVTQGSYPAPAAAAAAMRPEQAAG